MDRGRGGGNPWKRGRGQTVSTGGSAHHQQKAPRPSQLNAGTKQAEERFQKAKAQMQASAQKHSKNDYESSEEEEELESENILVSVLKSYSQLGGKSEDLGRTQRFLEDAFQSGAATCLICIASVKRNDPIWSCAKCYCFFHLTCIQRWGKDSIAHQKQASEEQPRGKAYEEFNWACPKCRHEYPQSATPQRYQCFCGRVDDPVYHPWNVPHSCGETCGHPLQPPCGHDCLLLCHPGPCPPCPKMVSSPCYCLKRAPRPQRCSLKEWSCGSACDATLSCGRHPCPVPCHPPPCPPCPQTSVQACACGGRRQVRPCADPRWQCDAPCGRPLPCGNHACVRLCHAAGACGDCPLSLSRTCPCGKTRHTLPCERDTPTCGDTCGLPLECGAHACSRPCHRDTCGPCLEVVRKQCRCGQHVRELPCQNRYLCETKCRNAKDCRRHPCNRKCCDGNCPPCEKPCERTLPCGRHKCASVCHRGPCYPCPLTVNVTCRCGSAVLTVPCGRQKRTKPPRCNKACVLPPDCHHPSRQPHRCHRGDCPPCRLACLKPLSGCVHSCPAVCHSAVWVTTEAAKPAGPWEKPAAPLVQMQSFPCPPCVVPTPVTCVGRHETAPWPCHAARPSSCGRQCGRRLACGNHGCDQPCHAVEGAADEASSGANCGKCEAGCERERPEGCAHPCTKPCHPGQCAPCAHMQRVRCHCGLNQLFVRCGEWTTADPETKKALQSCTNQCPKNYECGHRCHTLCHPGECPEPASCRKKVKVFCPCRRLRREVQCDVVRAGSAGVACDEACKRRADEELNAKAAQLELKRADEERRNREEVEKFEKKLQGRKKHRERRHNDEEAEASFARKYWIHLASLSGVLLAAYFFVFVQ